MQEPVSWKGRFICLINLWPLMKKIWRVGPGLAMLSLSCLLVRALLPLAGLTIGKLIIDLVATTVRGGSPDMPLLSALVLASFGVAILAEAAGRLSVWAESMLGDRYTNQLGVELLRHAATLDLADFEDASFQDRLERARAQSTGRMDLALTLVGTVQSIITLVSLSAALAVYYPWLLALLIGATLPAFFGETRYGALSYSLLHRLTPQRRELDYLKYLGSSPETAKEVRIFGLGRYLAERFERTASQYLRENRVLATRRAATGLVLGSLSTAAYYVAYFVILVRATQGSLSIGDVTLLSTSFSQSRSLIEGILLNISIIATQALHVEDLFSFLRSTPRIVSPAGACPPPRPIRTGIEFRDVGFRYPGSDRFAVRGLHFTLAPGERVALIGENGAGKTTIVKLLARLYDPTEGQILVDGVDLREYSLESWRDEIGVIFQDFVRYNMLFRENIAISKVDWMSDQSRVESAAGLSGALEIAGRLEKGFDQMIGQIFTKGVALSGGEWQKVALARAYMRTAQVLILDEPTSALDPHGERKVFEHFVRLMEDRIAILISHRFSTVRMADRILVLKEGRLSEEGSHSELLAIRGLYSELFELQAAAYR